jgi:diguanylate cyclase
MDNPHQPAVIAREAIKRLAERKLSPTPDNYRRIYAEVEGKETAVPTWPDTINTLLQQWDQYQVGLTQFRKREMLERVLINFGQNPDELCMKLANLARNWSESPVSRGLVEAGLDRSEAEGQVSEQMAISQLWRGCLHLLAGGMSDHWPDLARRAGELAEATGRETGCAEDDVLKTQGLLREILVRADDDRELLVGMQRLLRLMFENLGDVVAEDAGIRGQFATLKALVSGHLNYSTLHEAELGLQEIVSRQGQLRDGLRETKSKLKQLISLFIDRVGDLSSSTGDYHDRLQAYSTRIAQADEMRELSDVVEALTSDMGQMRDAMHDTHVQLIEARNNVQQAEQRIHSLEQELEEVSNLIREDQLTGALNRRGLDEAFTREVARVKRLGVPLSLALLDVDHFKMLNDSLGHSAGDQALAHLAQVIHQMLRPTDSLARFGGEEFLILLPNTEVSEAENVMRRLQRELTKQYFLHEDQHVLITFSAGVAQMQASEEPDALVTRADAAMYRAKAAGRNRVEVAA